MVLYKYFTRERLIHPMKVPSLSDKECRSEVCAGRGYLWVRQLLQRMMLYKYFTRERLIHPMKVPSLSDKEYRSEVCTGRGYLWVRQLLQRMRPCCYHFLVYMRILHPHSVSMSACKHDVLEHSLAQPPYLYY